MVNLLNAKLYISSNMMTIYKTLKTFELQDWDVLYWSNFTQAWTGHETMTSATTLHTSSSTRYREAVA